MQRVRARGAQATLSLVLPIGLLVGACLGILVSGYNADYYLPLVLIFAGVILVCLVLGGPRVRTFNSVPAWLMLATAVYIVPWLGAFHRGSYNVALPRPPTSNAVATTVALALLSLAAFVAGWCTKHVPIVLSTTRPILRRARRIYWIMEVASITFYAAAVRAAGVPLSEAFATLSDVGYSNQKAASALGFVILIGNVGFIVTPLLLLADAWQLRGRKAKNSAMANFVIILTIDLALGVRYRVFLLLGAVLLLWGSLRPAQARRRPRRLRFVIVGTIGGLIFLAAAGQISNLRQNDTAGRLGNLPLIDQLDLLTPGAAVVDRVKITGLLDGQSYADIPEQAVPRVFWPSKPEASTITYIRSLSDPAAGMSIPFFIEIYLNFGFLGVTILSFLLGLLGARAYFRWSRDTSTVAVVALALAPPLSIQLFSRGYAVQAVYTVLYLYGPLVFLRRLHRTSSVATSSELASERSVPVRTHG